LRQPRLGIVTLNGGVGLRTARQTRELIEHGPDGSMAGLAAVHQPDDQHVQPKAVPVAVEGSFRPHYASWSEEQRIEALASKKYSDMPLQMKREAVQPLNRTAYESAGARGQAGSSMGVLGQFCDNFA
jgi:hypothetical protein